METIWVPGIKKVPLIERSWDESYAVRPALVFVHHIMQGFRNYIGTTAPGPSGPSAHFTSDQFQGDLQQHIPLNRVAWTNGLLDKPTAKLAAEFPSHYSNKKKQIIIDANRPAITMETAGFSQPASYLTKEDWLSRDYRYSVFGYEGLPDEHGKIQRGWGSRLIDAQIEATKAVFDLGWIRDDPSEDTILGHCHLNSVNRPNDPGEYWVKWIWPRIIASVRGQQPKIPSSKPIERSQKKVVKPTEVKVATSSKEVETLTLEISSLKEHISDLEASVENITNRINGAEINL